MRDHSETQVAADQKCWELIRQADGQQATQQGINTQILNQLLFFYLRLLD